VSFGNYFTVTDVTVVAVHCHCLYNIHTDTDSTFTELFQVYLGELIPDIHPLNKHDRNSSPAERDRLGIESLIH